MSEGFFIPPGTDYKIQVPDESLQKEVKYIWPNLLKRKLNVRFVGSVVDEEIDTGTYEFVFTGIRGIPQRKWYEKLMFWKSMK